MKFRTIEKSLSFDPIVKDWPTREAAVAECVRVLVNDGRWPRDDARTTAASQAQCLVRDDGDDWTIRWESY